MIHNTNKADFQPWAKLVSINPSLNNIELTDNPTTVTFPHNSNTLNPS